MKIASPEEEEMSIQEIKGRIYACVDYELANVACIDTGQGLVLVDAPTLLKDISHWKEFISGMNAGDVEFIMTTHHHFDHVVGNRQLGGKVIMHEKARIEMLEEGGTMREAMAPAFPGWTKEEVDFVVSEPLVPPVFTFGDRMTLRLGAVTLRAVHLGGHTPGSICVYAEEDGVLFAGDNVTSGMHPFRGDGNFAEWIEALRWMQELDIEVIVPGHGEICRKDELDRLMEYLSRLWFITEGLIRKGMGREEVIREVNQRMIDFYEIEPEMLEGTKMLFDLGTSRLYDEILSQA